MIEADRVRIIADITAQIENLSEQIIEMNDDIQDLKAVKEILESYKCYEVSNN